MKRKRLFKFYFYCDSLNAALDNLITQTALNSANWKKSGDYYAERIARLIEAKLRLAELWRYIDGVMAELTESEKDVLRFYGAMRCGLSRIGESGKNEVRRVAVKFTRRARQIDKYAEGLRLVNKYYCLLYA